MTNHAEKTLHRETIFRGKVLDLVVDQVRLPNGKISSREIVLHRGAVAILALTEGGKAVFVKQYRKAMELDLIEIPAGKLEEGEEPLASAMRELEEETGYTAASWEMVHRFYTAPGFSNEKIYFYKATGVKEGKSHPDEDECIDVITLSLEEALSYINEGRIIDAKTIIAVYHWAYYSR